MYQKKNEKDRIRRNIKRNVIEKIVDRDNGQCIICGQPYNDIHHARYGGELHNIPNGIQKRNQEQNLVCLCRKCHDDIHHRSNKKKASQVRKYLETIYRM